MGPGGIPDDEAQSIRNIDRDKKALAAQRSQYRGVSGRGTCGWQGEARELRLQPKTAALACPACSDAGGLKAG